MNKISFRIGVGQLLPGLLPLFFIALSPCVGAAPGIAREQLLKNAPDIAVIDRVLATAKPGQTVVQFGDVGMKLEQLKIFRERLVAEQTGRQAENHSPDVVTPPGTTFKWPGGIVPFRFDPTQVSNGTITAAKMQQFRDGAAEWAAFANLHFNEFTGTTPPNFVTVQENAGLGEGGSSSAVGMAGGEQFLDFASNSWNRRTVCHEVGHAIGLYHEQQRDDRDTYVIIDWSNIALADQPSFAKLPGGSVAIGDYDFYSRMHYSRNAFAINSAMDTITMQPPYVQFADIIGNVYYRVLSKLDRAGMAVVYGIPSPLPSAIVTNTQDSGSGSLRAALYYAFDKSTDSPPVPTTVAFQIPITDPGFANNVFTIKPTEFMVAPGANTTVDGSTQTAFTGNTNPNGPEVVLDGSQLSVQGVFAPGLDLRETGCVVKNLVIGSFNEQGILIEGAAATGNVISGCYLGTNATGTSAMPNTFSGVEATSGANANIIGGTSSAARNIISGNASYGIAFYNAGTSSNMAEGNYIGLNAAGTGALPNTHAGIAIYGSATNNTVGSSTSAGGRNVISGNSAQGITISEAGTKSNKVMGNLIGLNPAGTASLGNQGGGIDIFGGASSSAIGSTSAVSSNYISGNVGAGINISAAGTKSNKVQHNFIGTNLTVTAAVPNNAGVQIFGGAATNTIGGTTASVRNVISGNNFQGIAISGNGTKSNTVAGNFIGTNKTGTAALPNTGAGVSLFAKAKSNIIGGPTAASRNVISGNLNQGITISDSGTSSNQLLSNFIGTNAAGTAALANSWTGVDIFLAASSNVIGAANKGNVISGNGNYGIALSGTGTTLNNVQGNFIGTNAANTGGIANGFAGIALFLGAQNNLIGNAATGAANVIAYNTFSGIEVYDSTTIGNDFNANSIFSNSALGINLVGGSENGFGVTANDLNDPDSGPNQLQNYPVLTSANSSAVIQGSLNSVPGKPYRIDFYSSPTADVSGFGEGQTWIGTATVTTDGSGNASFNVDFPGSLVTGSEVTATATGTGTGASGTSEFSGAIAVVP